MIITKEIFEAKIAPHLPIQRGNVKIGNLTLHVAENGLKWRALPSSYGKWDSVYKRVNRWAKNGVLERLFLALQKERIAAVNVEILALDSTCAKVHPNGCGALKKTAGNPSGKRAGVGIQSFTWHPRMTERS